MSEKEQGLIIKAFQVSKKDSLNWADLKISAKPLVDGRLGRGIDELVQMGVLKKEGSRPNTIYVLQDVSERRNLEKYNLVSKLVKNLPSISDIANIKQYKNSDVVVRGNATVYGLDYQLFSNLYQTYGLESGFGGIVYPQYPATLSVTKCVRGRDTVTGSNFIDGDIREAIMLVEKIEACTNKLLKIKRHAHFNYLHENFQLNLSIIKSKKVRLVLVANHAKILTELSNTSTNEDVEGIIEKLNKNICNSLPKKERRAFAGFLRKIVNEVGLFENSLTVVCTTDSKVHQLSVGYKNKKASIKL